MRMFPAIGSTEMSHPRRMSALFSDGGSAKIRADALSPLLTSEDRTRCGGDRAPLEMPLWAYTEGVRCFGATTLALLAGAHGSCR